MNHHLIDAYIALLKIDQNSTRIDLQKVYCLLRDQISLGTMQTSQYVQEKYEEIALFEKSGLDKLECNQFSEFFCRNLKNNKLSGDVVPVVTFWELYKYSKTEVK
jgi:hypothetical protein